MLGTPTRPATAGQEDAAEFLEVLVETINRATEAINEASVFNNVVRL